MAQTIKLTDENKLVVYTDNGTIQPNNEQSTVIKGVFEIDAMDVVKLGALLNDASFKKEFHIGTFLGNYIVPFSTNESFILVSGDKAIDDCEKYNEKLKSQYDKSQEVVDKLNKQLVRLKSRNIFERIFKKYEGEI